MRITSSLLAFIFLGVAAAGVIPEIAVRDNTVAGGKVGHGGHSIGLPSGTSDLPVPSGKHGPAPISRGDNPIGIPHPSVSLPNVSDHPKPTGIHFRPAGSRRNNPIDIPHPSVSLSDISDLPKPTEKYSRPAESRRDNPADIPRPSVPLSHISDLPKPTGKHFRPAGSRRNKSSDHLKPTGKHSHPAASRRANPTDIVSHIPAPHSTDSKDPHSHHPTTRPTVLTGVLPLPTNAPFQGSDHPGHSGEHSGTLTSHKARAEKPTIIHSIHPISRRASPTDTDPHHHQGGSEHPKPTGKTA